MSKLSVQKFEKMIEPLSDDLRETCFEIFTSCADHFQYSKGKRLRTPAVFCHSEPDHCEMIWYPGYTISVWEDSIRCYDGSGDVFEYKSPYGTMSSDGVYKPLPGCYMHSLGGDELTGWLLKTLPEDQSTTLDDETDESSHELSSDDSDEEEFCDNE